MIDRETFNISSIAESDIERELSNFADAPFVLDGVRYASAESFWQAIKLPEGSVEREMIARAPGRVAKQVSRCLGDIDHVTYRGKRYEVGTEDYQALMYRALEAKFDQNPHARALLLSTGSAEITHELHHRDGSLIPDSKTLPAKVFTGFLKSLRERYAGSGRSGRTV
ncbi:MAG TPA: NADAR family protein [Patescibacteria group bacterium]|jgi:predicted NAD-dependent protein-ADP-ribosyltransferase YbiA (DUF1768 family)